MRIFFPGLLLLVALFVFSISGWVLWTELPRASVGHQYGHLNHVAQLELILLGAALLLASACVAIWVWERIMRDRSWRSKLEG